MKKFFLILFVSFIILPVLVFAQTEKKQAVYFYSETCPRCQNVEKYFKDSGIYEKYSIQKREIYTEDNLEKLNSLFDAFGIAEANRGVPIVFFDRKFLAGDVPIIRGFVDAMENSEANFFPEAEMIKNLTQAEKDAADQQKEYVADIPLTIVAGAAIIDIFNPCSLAVLVMLVIFLIFSKAKKRFLVFGLLFALAIFFAHFLAAFGIYNSLSNPILQKYFSLSIGALAFLIGLANLRNIVWHKKSRLFENKKIYKLTVWWHGTKEKVIEKMSTPLSFFLVGAALSLFLLPCANEPYRAIIASLKEEHNLAKSILILVFYNLVFIFPFALCAWGLERFSHTKKFELFHEKIFYLIKMFLGVIMMFVGLYLIATWIN